MSMMFLPEEDVATIRPEDRTALVAAGVLAPNQPGLDAPFVGDDTVVPPPPDTGRRPPPGFDDTADDDTADDDEDEDAGTATTTDTAALFAQQQLAQRRENAFSIVAAFFQRAGLQGLEAQVRSLLAQGIEDTDAILFNLRDTEQFRTRFKANTARAKAGLPELDPATYIGLEQQYASLLRANRLPPGFYDDPDDFAKLLEGDVSPQELQSRINEGFIKVRDADPEVRRQMQTLYGVGSDEQLAAYFLDPDKGLAVLQREARAAEIAARGREQGRLQLTTAQAEELARRGITPEEALRDFTRRGLLEGLYQPLAGEQALTGEQEIGAIFGFDPEAQRRLEQRAAERRAEFQAGGQFARTTGATSGTIETGVGLAQ
jgi:hypothetical protein